MDVRNSATRLVRESHVPSEATGSDVVPVERCERDTTPAPPDSAYEPAAFPSARPTSVPDYDVAALAFETSVHHRTLPGLHSDLSDLSELSDLSDLATPTRSSAPVPSDLELRASFVLLHVDDHSSVRDIAMLTGIPSNEVMGALFTLTTAGLVKMSGTQPVTVAPPSGERPRMSREK